jgi:hypothetical protein
MWKVDAKSDWNGFLSFILYQYLRFSPVSCPIHRAANPLHYYSDLTTLNEVHTIGGVWANMLHNV